MRFADRAFFLPDNSVNMSWVHCRPDYDPHWRRADRRRRDRGLHPLEHLLQELAMLEDDPHRGCSHGGRNMSQHHQYRPYHRACCMQDANRPTVHRLKGKGTSSPSQAMPELRRYSPYQQYQNMHSTGHLIPRSEQAQWRTSFDMSSFKPCNITVKVKNGRVDVSAKREERDGRGFYLSEVSRSERLPGDVDVGSVTAWLNDNGVMHVTADRRPLQPQSNDRPQLTGSGNKATQAAEDIVVQVFSNGERNDVHVSVEDTETDPTGQKENHRGESTLTPNAISVCTDSSKVGDTANTQSTDPQGSATEGEEVSDEPSNKAQKEDTNPQDDDIILTHEETPVSQGDPGSPDRADDAGTEDEEVMVVDEDKGAAKDTTPAVPEDQTHREDPSSPQDNGTTTLVQGTTSSMINPTDTPFNVTLNLSTYDPENLRVRVSGQQVHVTAERSLCHPDGSTMYRRYAKSFPLPPEADAESVTSVLTSEGQLTVTATAQRTEVEDRMVTIERVEN